MVHLGLGTVGCGSSWFEWDKVWLVLDLVK